MAMENAVFYALATWLLLLWIYFLWSRRHFYRVAWQLPGPMGLPFIGLGLQMMHPETFLQYMERISKCYATPFISWMGTSCFLYVNDPETVETIFNSSHCTNKGEFYRFMAAAIGDGLFTSSSPRWNKHRRLINPAFSRQIINNFLPIFNAEADLMLSKFADLASTDTPLEIYEILKRNVLEAACQTTMGKRMNFENEGSAHIFEAYKGVTEVCVRRMLTPWLYPDMLYRRSALFVRQQQVVHVLFSFIESLLQLKNNKSVANGMEQQQQEQKHSTINENESENCARTANVNVNENGKMNGKVNMKVNVAALTDADADGSAIIRKSKAIFVEQVRSHVEQGQLSWDDVRAEANVIIAATFETTSTALYIVCLCLAMHPDYQEKVYEELSALFPEDKSPEIDNTHLEKMPYTEMVINEALRLYSPVPMVLRSAADDFRLRNDVIIPRGTQIGIDIYNMQRDERIWGSAAKQFKPEAHFGPYATNQHAFAFIPFTKGLRMCIGYRYALMLMKVFVAKIFRQYRIKTAATLDQLIVKGTISLKLAEYPLCQLEARSS
ncbi:probable cytochrome P450 313b1 [Anastrepha ludens]|uniref:probable cytochrome P450 313b1 n=1 Tax=Anastrepha ludens TaxID=28586 RepID=UPI0023B0768C|nr:probable cytochrome P450 313b1 [Anastrepha ludens]